MFVAAVAVAFVWVLPSESIGQGQPGAKRSAAEGEPITLAAVQALRKAAAAAPNSDDATKKLVDGLYENAIGLIQAAERFSLQSATLRKEHADVAKDLKEQQSQLSKKPQPTQPDTSNWTLAELQTRTAAAVAAASLAQQELRNTRAEIDRRTMRRSKLPELRVTVRKKLAAVVTSLKVPPPKNEPPEVTTARRTLRQAEQLSLLAEFALVEQESKTYAETSRVWTGREDLARRNLLLVQRSAQFLSEKLGERRQRDAAAKALAARRAALNAHPAVKPAAERNSILLDQNSEIVAKVEQSRRELEKVESEKNSLQTQFETMRKRAGIAQYSRAIGQLLRAQKAGLPDTYTIRERIRLRQSDIADINLRILARESEQLEWLDTGAAVNRGLQNVPASTPQTKRQEIAEELERVSKQRGQILVDLIENARKQLDLLVALDTTERGMVEAIDAHEKFIAEHILWIRSTNPLGWRTVQQSWTDLRLLVSVSHWREVWDAILGDVSQKPFWPICFVGILSWLYWRRAAFKRALAECGRQASSRQCTSLRPTLRAIVLTALVTAPISAIPAFAGWRLAEATIPESFASSLGTTLLFVAGINAALKLIHQACRTDGLGMAHFGWNSMMVSAIRFCVHSLQIAWLPLVAITVLSEAWGNEPVISSVGRLSFLAGQIILGLVLFRLLRPSGPLMTALVAAPSPGLLVATRRTWTALLVGLPLLLAILSVTGFHYTAIQLTIRLLAMFAWFGGLLALRAILLRWLLVTHRAVAIQRHREKVAAQAADATKRDDTTVPIVSDAIPDVTLSDIKQQTRDLIRIASAVAVFAGTWFIWKGILPALLVFDRVRLWPDALAGGDGSPEAWATLGDLLIAIAIVALTFVAARNLPGFAEITVLARLPLDAGARYAATSVTRYLIIMIGLIFSFRQIGIGWASVQWLAAAMTVGLGFGLQEIFANFVSGLIMLFERPVRVGDTVTVGEVTGTVTRIRIRATTILDWDNKELIVPNKQFVTGNLINWTLSNSNLRLVSTVGIAYGSDTRLATQLLRKVAAENPNVLKEPAPVVVFQKFGDSSLEIQLRVFVASVSHYRHLIHELNQAIDDEFKQHGIVIAFPQRDLHLRSVPEDLKSQMMKGD